MDVRQRLRALAKQPVTARVVERAVDPPDDRLPGDRIADQVRIAQCSSGIIGSHDLGDRSAGGGRTLLHGGFQLHARVHIVRRSGAQYQRLPLIGDGVERPRGPARPAGQRPQVLDDDTVAKRGAEHSLELVLHLRPNPKSRWATRRIWISSAPSVMR